MTSTQRSEWNAYASDGPIFYLPAQNVPGTVSVDRLYDSAIGDHMDSTIPGEGGYQTEGSLGYAFTSQGAFPNLWQFIRVGDGNYHATTRTGETLPGYSFRAGLGDFGISRYTTNTTSNLVTTAGGVTIASNGVAGGSLWSWTWNGVQFISNGDNGGDYGREIQAAVFYHSSSGTHNPTEAGDQYGQGTLPVEQKHGSPVSTFSVNGNTQTTNSIPLEYNPSSFGGGPDNPVLYPQILLGKQITLDFNNLGPVAEYITTLTSPFALTNAEIEIPTWCLLSNFTHFWTVDAATQTLTEVTSSVGKGTNVPYVFTPSSGFGGVIISDSAGSNAMGIYGVTIPHGGSVSTFSLWSFLCYGPPSGTAKLNAVYGPATIPAGNSVYHSWVMSGTVSGVQSLMRSLYNEGVK